jgi:hypothetical protein
MTDPLANFITTPSAFDEDLSGDNERKSRNIIRKSFIIGFVLGDDEKVFVEGQLHVGWCGVCSVLGETPISK